MGYAVNGILDERLLLFMVFELQHGLLKKLIHLRNTILDLRFNFNQNDTLSTIRIS